MSHELRTPLNSLLILAEQLEDNPDRNMTATQVEYATVIRSSGKELLNLVNGILDLAKVESGTVTVDHSALRLTELRRGLCDEFEHVAGVKSLGFSVEIDHHAPDLLVTDVQRLRQILTNLVANAVKFTSQGDVRVRIASATGGWTPGIASLDTSPAVVAIEVIDTGIGIEECQHRRIFEAFVQGDGTTARIYGGTGLGLSISRELSGLLGGEITLTSSRGHGSTFTLYLPIGDPAIVPGEPQSPVLVGPSAPPEWLAPDLNGVNGDCWPGGLDDRPFESLNVLVVDDDFRNIFALTSLLERGHAIVTVAESGADAITTLQRTPHFDLVLMDVMMPVMDGYATMRAIREFERFKALPIIAVTGKVVADERQRCLAAGASDYVPKPVDSAELLAVLRPWLPSPATAKL